jgi:hypothetical protein
MKRDPSAAQKAANARWQVRRRKLINAGQWQPFVDAELVREHLRKVNAAGMPYMVIAKRVGLAQDSSLQHLMWGRGPYGPGKQVRRETAELVLSFWPSLEDFPDAARIDATGTQRRIQALAVRGWSRRMIADQIGMREDHFRKACSRDRVTARLARKVAAVYDAWWDQNPLDQGVSLASVSRTLADAEQAGFHSPLAWDDDTIDDPNAGPVTDAVAPIATEGGNVADRWLHGEAVVLGAEDRKQVLQHLMEWTNDTPQEIAAQLEISLDTLWQTWSRLKKQARQEGRREPWRRVYVPRDRTLNQTEMEEAA